MHDQPTQFRDRKVGLIVLGIIQIILGALCALCVPFTILGAVMSQMVDQPETAPPVSALTIVPGVVFYLILAVLSALVAVGVYRMRKSAWLGSIILTLLWFVSAAMTFARVDLLQYYEAMGFGEQQIEAIKQIGMSSISKMIWTFPIWMAVFLGFILFTGRYFYDSRRQRGGALDPA